ncbi:hypothetical protein TWF281_004395 [Arthrobotrys megalospora]
MPFPAGYYSVKSVVDGRHIFRSPIEDLSLRPKSIWALKIGAPEPRPWLVRHKGDYTDLEALGAPTGVYRSDDKRPFAFLIEMDYTLGWILEPVDDAPPGTFRIKTKEGNRYWEVETEELAFGRLIKLAEKSPAATQLFVFSLRSEVYAQDTKSDSDWATQYRKVPEAQFSMSNKREKKFQG